MQNVQCPQLCLLSGKLAPKCSVMDRAKHLDAVMISTTCLILPRACFSRDCRSAYTLSANSRSSEFFCGGLIRILYLCSTPVAVKRMASVSLSSFSKRTRSVRFSPSDCATAVGLMEKYFLALTACRRIALASSVFLLFNRGRYFGVASNL